MRGGHAPDVNRSNSFTRARALAKARAAERSSSVSGDASIVKGQNEKALQGNEPSVVGTNTTKAAPAAVTARRQGGGRLSNAVSARQHRSPSWYREDESGKGRGSVGCGRGGASGAGGGGSRTDANAAIEGGGSNREEAAGVPAGSHVGPDDPLPKPPAAARRGGEAIDARDSRSGKHPASTAAPRTGGVSARLHHSPSRILRGGATLRDHDASPEAAGLADTATRRTKPTATARSVGRSQPSINGSTAGDDTASAPASKGGVRAAPTASPGMSSSRTGPNAASKPKQATGKVSSATSSSSGVSKPSRQQGLRGNVSSGRNSGGRGTRAGTIDSGQTRQTEQRSATEHQNAAAAAVRGARTTAVHQERDNVRGPKGDSPAVTVAASESRNCAAGAAPGDSSEVSSQPVEAADPAGRAAAKPQRHRRAHTDPIPGAVSRDNDNPVPDTVDRTKSFAHSGGRNEGGATGSLQNYKPFSWRANTKRTLSEGVMVGGGRSTPLRPSFFISFPEEDEPPPPPPPPSLSSPPPPSHSLGERRPSVGPVNPRAMYGHVPPPPPASDDPLRAGITRRPSVVIVPPPSPRDQIGAAAKSAAGAAASKRATQKRSKGGAPEVAGESGRDGFAAFGSRKEERRRPSDAADAGSGSRMRKSRSSSGDGMRKANSGRGSRAPGANLSASSSPNVLSASSQGMLKVGKIQPGLNRAQASGDVGCIREAPRESVRWHAGQRTGVAGTIASTAEVKTAWHNMGTRDTVAPLHFTEASVQELRKLAAAAAARQARSSSSEEDEGDEGDEGNEGGVNGRGRPHVAGHGSSNRTMSWEQQLRTMAGVDVSSDASNASRRRSKTTDKTTRSSSRMCLAAGSEGHEGVATNHHPGEAPSGKVCRWSHSGAVCTLCSLAVVLIELRSA